eukprot:COSAG02_NODE_187_length_30377_cov_3.636271_35_plen_144_part_00
MVVSGVGVAPLSFVGRQASTGSNNSPVRHATLCALYALAMRSLCARCALSVLLYGLRYAMLPMRSLCALYAPLCARCALSMLLYGLRYAMLPMLPMRSLCARYALSMLLCGLRYAMLPMLPVRSLCARYALSMLLCGLRYAML